MKATQKAVISILLLGLWAWDVSAQTSIWPAFSQPSASSGSTKNRPFNEKSSEDVAIIIGIEDYGWLDDIPGAVNNANDWLAYLATTHGVRADRFSILRNGEATKTDIMDEIKKLVKKASPRGNLWFVFIGHGMSHGNDGMLVTANAQSGIKKLLRDSISRSELLDLLSKGSQRHTVVVIDACFSGKSNSSGKRFASGLQPAFSVPIPPKVTQNFRDKLIVLSAASGDEYAGPLPGESRPAFSYLLLGAMRGWAEDGEGDGVITAGEAIEYIKDTFGSLVKDRDQTPEITVGSPGYVLARGASEVGPDRARIAIEMGKSKIHSVPQNEIVLNCMRRNNPEDCVKLGRQRLNDPISDKKLAVEYFDVACANGGIEGCYALAQLYDIGDIVPKDLQKAFELYKSVCDADHAEACYNIGNHFLFGKGVAADARQAFLNFDKACNKKHVNACLEVGRMCLEEQGCDYNVNKAAHAFSKACDSGTGAGCNQLASLYSSGRYGGGRSVRQAIELHRKACEYGEAQGCYDLATYNLSSSAGIKQNATAAEYYFGQACQKGLYNACTEQGKLNMGDHGFLRNLERAILLFKKACDGNEPNACRILGGLYGSANSLFYDPFLSKQFVEKSCKLGIQSDCG